MTDMAPPNSPQSHDAAFGHGSTPNSQESGVRVRPYEDDDFDDEGFVLSCTWCSGEGEFFGNELPGYDPGWHDPEMVYPCPACSGSGERRDQRLF